MAKKSKALITGCAGITGAKLIKELLDKGFEVIGVDNLSTGKIENFESIIQKKAAFQFINGDIRDLSLLSMIKKTDYVFHMADMEESNVGIVEMHNVNVSGTLNVLEYCKRHSATLIFKSAKDCKLSGCIYDTQKRICKEYIELYAELGIKAGICIGTVGSLVDLMTILGKSK